ncbi:MAG: TatD family hydrolase [Aerococcus sp.]|nr:TatD family hydrolase [Aerococcus sp.]
MAELLGPWSDGHTHLEQRASLVKTLTDTHMRTIVNHQSAKEWQWGTQHLQGLAKVMRSFGIHPWDSDRYLVSDLKTYYQQADVIGEIGLDREWTTIPLAIQRPIFIAQLQLAQALQKPVIVHTKGAEAECLTLLKQYPNRYYIHWYSAEHYQKEYLAQGYWFSIGPDVFYDTAVQHLATQVPIERLLLETDGLTSIAWAHQQNGRAREVSPADWVATLADMATFIAQLRKTTSKQILRQVDVNLKNFLAGVNYY